MPDQERVINAMSVGLKLVDQFHELAMYFMGKTPQPRSGIAEQAGNTLQVVYSGHIAHVIQATQLNLNEWDDTRYRSLERRTKISWNLFHELYAEEPALPPEEQARIKVRMERIKEELCEDFNEMIKIYERTLGIALPDHYTLPEVCQNQA
jgi:hypothetical protein